MRVNILKSRYNENKTPVIVKEKGLNYYTESSLNMPQKIADMMRAVFEIESLCEEHVWILPFRGDNPIGVIEESMGTVDCSICNPGSILTKVLLSGCNKFIIVHNHPSGDINPSKDDFNSTKRLKDSCAIISTQLLDHIIIGGNNYYSMQEMGYI